MPAMLIDVRQDQHVGTQCPFKDPLRKQIVQMPVAEQFRIKEREPDIRDMIERMGRVDFLAALDAGQRAFPAGQSGQIDIDKAQVRHLCC